jgi:hypothetical protein
MYKKYKQWLDTKISFYSETSGDQKSNLYINVVNFSSPGLIGHLWQFKIVVFLHRCLLCAVLLILECSKLVSWPLLVTSIVV